jgi:hypothetical protein
MSENNNVIQFPKEKIQTQHNMMKKYYHLIF